MYSLSQFQEGCVNMSQQEVDDPHDNWSDHLSELLKKIKEEKQNETATNR